MPGFILYAQVEIHSSYLLGSDVLGDRCESVQTSNMHARGPNCDHNFPLMPLQHDSSLRRGLLNKDKRTSSLGRSFLAYRGNWPRSREQLAAIASVTEHRHGQVGTYLGASSSVIVCNWELVASSYHQSIITRTFCMEASQRLVDKLATCG
jgi:hypothetical protein